MILEDIVELAPNPKVRVFRLASEGRSYNLIRELWKANGAPSEGVKIPSPIEFSSRLSEIKEYSFLWDKNKGYFVGILVNEDKKTIMIPFINLYIFHSEE
jgi:hypothetical protein